MWIKLDKTKANIDCYNKNSYMEYLEFMKSPTVYGTEYDIIMLCEFLQVSIKVFSPSLFSYKKGMCHCEEPVHFGDVTQMLISLKQNINLKKKFFKEFRLQFFVY